LCPSILICNSARARELSSLTVPASSISSFALFFGFLHQESCLLVCRARAAPERVVLKGGFASPARLEWCLTREDAWSALTARTLAQEDTSSYSSASSRVICTPECTSTPLALCPPSSCIQICSRTHTPPALENPRRASHFHFYSATFCL
jgi:hypothetical protein